MRTHPFVAVLASLASLSAACASPAGPAGPSEPSAADGAASSCEELQAAAREELQGALDAHAACEADSDCVTIAFSSACFDSCSRAVAASGADAVDAARGRANAGVCARYEAKGCTFFIPPCDPPQSPRCASGRCV